MTPVFSKWSVLLEAEVYLKKSNFRKINMFRKNVESSIRVLIQWFGSETSLQQRKWLSRTMNLIRFEFSNRWYRIGETNYSTFPKVRIFSILNTLDGSPRMMCVTSGVENTFKMSKLQNVSVYFILKHESWEQNGR